MMHHDKIAMMMKEEQFKEMRKFAYTRKIILLSKIEIQIIQSVIY